MSLIQVHEKVFQLFISREQIQRRVTEIGKKLEQDYEGLNPLFLSVLNGSFVFAADLFRSLNIEAEISFIKLASYKGTTSSGNVVTAIGLEESLSGRHVILLEDIIDTGRTLHSFIPELLQRYPASLKIASFLSKPDALKFPVVPDYLGFEIPNKFVLGYGLDYDGLGRNLPDLYELVQN